MGFLSDSVGQSDKTPTKSDEIRLNPILRIREQLRQPDLLLLGVLKTVYYIRPVTRTIIGVCLVARFCETLDLWWQLDIFTVYFLIGQFMCKTIFAVLVLPIFICSI